MASCNSLGFCNSMAARHSLRFFCNRTAACNIRRLAMSISMSSHEQDFHPRTSLQLLSALEGHVAVPGKGVLEGLKNVLCVEKREGEKANQHLKEKIEGLRETIEGLRDRIEDLEVLRAEDRVALLEAKGVNNTQGLFELFQGLLVLKAEVTTMMTGSQLWEAILRKRQRLRGCIESATKIPESDLRRQAVQCSTVYSVLLQHIDAGKELSAIRAEQGKILFQRGPLSPEQLQIFLCIGIEAGVVIAEDPSTRPC